MDAPEGDHPLIRRRDAAQATLDTWSGRPFRLGTSDCVRMVAAHLRSVGYKVRLPPQGAYRTVPSATRVLKLQGHETLADALDAAGLERIAPAETIVGDVMLIPSEHALGCLVVCMGNGRIAGWHPDHGGGVVVMQPLEMIAAWRVDPR